MNEVADKVLDEVAPLAVSTFKPHVPYDRKEKDSFHARNHVRASKTRDGYGGRYKLVGVFDGDGAKLDWSIAQYLFYVENGTSKMVARPFMKKAEAAVKSVVRTKNEIGIRARNQSQDGGIALQDTMLNDISSH
mgnify:CR=1 FL=1